MAQAARHTTRALGHNLFAYKASPATNLRPANPFPHTHHNPPSPRRSRSTILKPAPNSLLPALYKPTISLLKSSTMPTYRHPNPTLESIFNFLDMGYTVSTRTKTLIFVEFTVFIETLALLYVAWFRGDVMMACTGLGGGVALSLIIYSRVKTPELRWTQELF
ncbi:hypothetical protein V8F06_010808 [Rhypophila decipiens]